jgi:hypothetical protein
MNKELSSTLRTITELNLLSHLDEDQIAAFHEEAKTKTLS